MKTIFVSDMTDKRMIYACDFLRDMGYLITKDRSKADYVLPPVASKPSDDELPYMTSEPFLVANAFLTAEAAVCTAKDNSDNSLVSAPVLVVGYGRIARALCHLLSAYTPYITVCARSASDRAFARHFGADVIDFPQLCYSSEYNFVFNTVPHPVFNDAELTALCPDCLLVDLASFPGGVDKHIASARGVRLVEARGLPGRFSPRTAGKIIADTVDDMIKGGRI